MKYINELKSVATLSITALQNVANVGYKTYSKYNFHIKDLRDFRTENIMLSTEYKNVFDELLLIKGPVLYWFEIVPDYKNDIIIDRLNNYKKLSSERATPAIKINPDYNTNILYVGKVKRHFFGRVIQHLGFSKNPQTQGLQLYHWLKDEPLILELHVCEFNYDMVDLIGVIENDFARLLKPLIGKHK